MLLAPEPRPPFRRPLRVFGFLKRIFRREPELDPVALVLVETAPRVLSEGQIRLALQRAGVAYGPIVAEPPFRHRMTVQGFEITVLTSPDRYFPEDDGGPPAELRIADVVDRHRAAVLLDCWAAPPGRTREESTDVMGRLAAELADDTTLGVYAFHTQRLNLADETLLTMFREGRATEAMNTATYDPILPVADADEAMAAAIAEAKARWPEFVTAFAETEGPFLVKARFAYGLHDDSAEHMWFEPDAVTAAGAEGILQNSPMHVPRLRQGSRVSVRAEDVSDWMYVRDGEPVGGFTQAVLSRG